MNRDRLIALVALALAAYAAAGYLSHINGSNPHKHNYHGLRR